MLLLLLLLFATGAHSATFHVSPVGNDTASGDAQNPWQTLSKANQTLVAGDTLLIHAGRYAEAIRPVNDGIDNAQRITYRVFGDGPVVLTHFVDVDGPAGGALALGTKRYVTVSGRPTNGTPSTRSLILEPQHDVGMLGTVCGSEGVIIENVEAQCSSIDKSCSRGITFCLNFWQDVYETRFNVLRNSHIVGFSSTSDSASDYTEDLITIAGDSHHNLVEGNTLETVRHSVLYADSPICHTNIVRNNVIRNPQHTALSMWSAGVGRAEGAEFLVENNYLQASGETARPDGGPGSALQWGADEIIARYNVITESGAVETPHKAVSGITGATSTTHGAPYFATDGRLYNNTIVKHHGAAIGIYNFNVDPVDLGRNVFVNNFIYGANSSLTGNQLLLYWDESFPTGDRYINNVFGNPTPSTDILISTHRKVAKSLQDAIEHFESPIEPSLGAWGPFANIEDNAPGFRSYSQSDYRLAANSVHIDNGAPLTQVSDADAGQGTTLTVADSRFFFAKGREFPEWMGIASDWIAVGPSVERAQKVALVSADKQTHRLTLSTSIERKAGDYVWLWRDSDGTEVIYGTAPDIGAYEAMPEHTSELQPPHNFRVIQ